MNFSFSFEKFSGTPAINILSFLLAFRDSADHIGISEGAAARGFLQFLAQPARARLERQASFWEGDPVPLYTRMVNWLLTAYAKPTVLGDAYLKIVSFRQTEWETESQAATRLQELAMRVGGVFSDKELENIYVDGLRPEVRPIVSQIGQLAPAGSAGKHSSAFLEDLAAGLGEVLRKHAELQMSRISQAAKPVKKPGIEPVFHCTGSYPGAGTFGPARLVYVRVGARNPRWGVHSSCYQRTATRL